MKERRGPRTTSWNPPMIRGWGEERSWEGVAREVGGKLRKSGHVPERKCLQKGHDELWNAADESKKGIEDGP